MTRFITVHNLAAAGTLLRVGFTRNGVNNPFNNYFTVDGTHSETFELRVTSVYFAGNSGSVEFSMCAGLTNIDERQMPQLSGTLDGGAAGWIGVG